MTRWITPYAVASASLTLSREAFSEFIFLALDAIDGQEDSQALSLVSVISGSCVCEPALTSSYWEGVHGSEAHPGALEPGWGMTAPTDASFPYKSDDGTLWYQGKDRAAIAAALRQASYGSDDIMVDLPEWYSYTFYALARPRDIAFMSGRTGLASYLTTSQFCKFPGTDGEIEYIDTFALTPTLATIYGVITEIYTEN